MRRLAFVIELSHHRAALAACQCGKVKASASHLACGVCLAKVDPALVAEFCEKARTKRGAPSYYAARKRVVAALRALETTP